MHTKTIFSLTLAGLLLVPSFAGAEMNPEDFPKRKPGLWEIKTTMATMGITQTAKHCIDETTDKEMMVDAKEGGDKDCQEIEFKKESDTRFVGKAECASKGMTMVSTSVFEGDFSSNYTGDVTVKMTPAVMGMGEQRMKLSAKWVGPCEEGQKPGDIILGGTSGTQFNPKMIEEMMKNLPKNPG